MISKRLKTVANMVTKGYCVADIGTDHAYVPLYLIKNHISPLVYGMDIHDGPLRIAAANIENAGYSDQIILNQADGMESLKPGQVQSVVISGMGGELITEILCNSKINASVKEFILSPQKNPDVLRKYLTEHEFMISDEVMLQEEGKYYVILRAVHGVEKPYSREELLYGRRLIERKDRILCDYLHVLEKKFLDIYSKMLEYRSNQIASVEQKLGSIQKILEKINDM